MPIEPPKIFISHSWDNKPLVRRLEAELKAAGAGVWVDHAGVRGGDNLPKEISAALAWCNTVILVWSQSAAQSHWVELEWTNAISLRKLIIPCRVDKAALPALLANLLYVDFTEVEKGITELREAVQLAQRPLTIPSVDQTEKFAHVLRRGFAGALPSISNIPHLRNPNFTGREELLQQLRTAFTSKHAVAMYGLGGVGKTQLALEYAFRYADEYQMIWWLRAEDPTTLAAGYASLAQALNLPEKDAKEKSVAVDAVKRWLNHYIGWLLIFDNAQQIDDISPYLPQSSTGHVLITSRNVSWGGIASTFQIKPFDPQESVMFLCHRTGQSDEVVALQLAEALGHLPLAVEQAAAYIAVTAKSLAAYLELFQKYQLQILERGKPSPDYPDTVATAWELAFQRVKEQSSTAANLLNLCAFLASDGIPINWLGKGIKNVSEDAISPLADPLIFADAIATLRNHSFVEVRDDELFIHKLVQVIARNRIEENARKMWARIALQVIINGFPSSKDHAYKQFWPEFERLLTQTLVAAKFVHGYGASSEEFYLLFYQFISSWIGPLKNTDFQSLKFYSCFISYSHQDENFIKLLHTNLRDHGIRCWFAPEDMKVGDKIRESINEAIEAHDKLLLVLSKTSISSQWVEQEVEKALERERTSGRFILVPIRIDNAIFTTNAGWAQYLKNTRNIGDFSQWQDSFSYKKALDKLLRNLQVD